MSTAYPKQTTCEASKLQHKTNTTFKANTLCLVQVFGLITRTIIHEGLNIN